MERYIYISVTYDGETLAQDEAPSTDEVLECSEIKSHLCFIHLCEE